MLSLWIDTLDYKFLYDRFLARQNNARIFRYF